jgi:hypothetical protein
MNDYVLRIAAIIQLLEFASEGDDGFHSNLSHANAAKIKITKTAINRAITIMDYFTRNSLKILMRTESPVAALPSRQQALYENLPLLIRTTKAIEIGEGVKISKSTVKRLIYNTRLFKPQPDGSYRKLYT